MIHVFYHSCLSIIFFMCYNRTTCECQHGVLWKWLRKQDFKICRVYVVVVYKTGEQHVDWFGKQGSRCFLVKHIIIQQANYLTDVGKLYIPKRTTTSIQWPGNQELTKLVWKKNWGLIPVILSWTRTTNGLSSLEAMIHNLKVSQHSWKWATILSTSQVPASLQFRDH